MSEPLRNVDEDGNVTIPLEVYEGLIQESRMLDALQAAGVDNWEGYSEAQELMEDELF